ncbi:MAG: hypothetical protein JJU13_08970 [Balneolaceae bacterium]|nr:hypothetical protein [Balneolaceae bacterium]
MEKHRKLLHIIIHRVADLVVIVLVLVCIGFAVWGFKPDHPNLMLYILILLSLTGIGISFSKRYMREHSDHSEMETEDETENHPIAQIKSVLFLEVPLEKIIMGYFICITLVYSSMLIFGFTLPVLDLALLTLSGIITLLLFYNLVTVFGIAKWFSWRVLLFLILSCIISALMMARPEVISISLLQEAMPYMLTVHLLGLVLGLGGAIIIDVMIFHFLGNFKISTREAVIMHLLSQMIVLGLILLVISGIALMFTDLHGYLENPRFLMKMTAVGIVSLNGAVLNLYVAPKMELISLREEDRESNQTLVKASFIVGAVSAISWLTVFFLAMIEILETFSYITLLVTYMLLLAMAIGGGLFTKQRYEKSAKQEE